MRSKTALVVMVLAGAVLGGGCEVAHVKESLTTRYSGTDESSQMDFWHELAERPLASNDEAAQALLLFVDGTAPATSYEDRVNLLKEKGLYPGYFDKPGDEAVQRGVVAYALCKVLKIRGGITMSITGVSERYAVRELVDMELFPTSSPGQTFSGTELVGVIGKAEDYQRGGGGEKTPGGLSTPSPDH